MRSEVEMITEQALKLSLPARACIVEALLESLDFEEDFPFRQNGEMRLLSVVLI